MCIDDKFDWQDSSLRNLEHARNTNFFYKHETCINCEQTSPLFNELHCSNVLAACIQCIAFRQIDMNGSSSGHINTKSFKTQETKFKRQFLF